MERKDLLKANVKIFKSQGAALDKYAKKTVKVNTGTEFKTLILYSVEIWMQCRRILHWAFLSLCPGKQTTVKGR